MRPSKKKVKPARTRRGGARPGSGRKKLDVWARLAAAAAGGTGIRLSAAEAYAVQGRVERAERADDNALERSTL